MIFYNKSTERKTYIVKGKEIVLVLRFGHTPLEMSHKWIEKFS